MNAKPRLFLPRVLNVRILAGLLAAVALSACSHHSHFDDFELALYAANYNNDTVTAYDDRGREFGAVVEGASEIEAINGLVVDGDGSIYVVGQLSNNVVRYSPGRAPFVFDPANAAGLDKPQGITFGPDGLLYVASSANDRIVRFDPGTGAFVDIFALMTSTGHDGPGDLAFGPDGNLYVSAFAGDRILKFDHSGGLLASFDGPAGSGLGNLAFGPDDALYVEDLDLADSSGSILRLDPSSGFFTTFISKGTGGLQSPGGFTLGPDNNFYLADIALNSAGNDIGSSVLVFDGFTGAPLGGLVGNNQDLDNPLFLAFGPAP